MILKSSKERLTDMSLFTIIPDAIAILNAKGVFKQTEVYVREGVLYAKWSSGFIGLRHYDNGTTIPNVKWEHLEGVEYEYSVLGKMMRKGSTVRENLRAVR
ncbi:hypothetical protein [Aminobacter phage Erebus]|nr:hypothetical protein [Aminobacter phage Erebus]